MSFYHLLFKSIKYEKNCTQYLVHGHHFQKAVPPLLEKLEKKLLQVFNNDSHNKLIPRGFETPCIGTLVFTIDSHLY